MKNIIFTLLILIVTIISFEVFLRYSPFSYGITPMQYDKDIGMWHKKNFSDFIIKDCYKVKYEFDKFGRIKNNYKYDYNKKDIVLLGDSQIEALMVDNEKIIHNSLYRGINGKFNVLNYGLSGTGPSQQLEILKNKVDLNNIDTLVHFIFLENDLNDGDPENLNGTNRPKVYIKFQDLDNYEIIKPRAYDIREKIRDFLGDFELYVYLKKTIYFYKDLVFNKLRTKKANSKIIEDNNRYTITNEVYKWKQLYGSIYQINKIASKNKFKYKVIIFSSYESNGYTKYREKFEEFLNIQNISYNNIIPFLEILETKQELSFACDGHWNNNTHQEIAKYLSKGIK